MYFRNFRHEKHAKCLNNNTIYRTIQKSNSSTFIKGKITSYVLIIQHTISETYKNVSFC